MRLRYNENAVAFGAQTVRWRRGDTWPRLSETRLRVSEKLAHVIMGRGEISFAGELSPAVFVLVNG